MADQQQAPHGRPFYLKPRFIAAVVAVVLVIVFIAQNTARTRMQFLWVDVTTAIWVGFVIDVILGFVIGFFVGRSRYKGEKR